ncbi:MAG: Type secretion system rane fusion protein PrsE [Pseudomonadota bacterium]
MTHSRFWTTLRQQASATRLMVLGLCVFVAWANLFELDQTVRSSGQVIASARNQVIQAADGGVLTQLMVSEGEHVRAGQIVAQLETTRSEASFQEVNGKLLALQAALIRAKAESSEQELKFDAKFDPQQKFKLGQQQIYLQKKQSLEDDLTFLRAGLKLSEEELRISQQLYKSGDLSQVEVMKAQRQVHDSQGRINSLRNKYLQDAKQDVIRLEDEISSNRYKLHERQSLLDHSTLTTPVAGIVKILRINTVGGVLRAGDELMHISPTESAQVIEAKINPRDIGELEIGMPVSIKLDAFDFSVYGMLQGNLSYISSDTLSEAGPGGSTQTYYRIQVALDPAQATHPTKLASPKSLISGPIQRLNMTSLKPGMTATLDIRTRTRTIMHYLTKPVQKAFSGALHER